MKKLLFAGLLITTSLFASGDRGGNGGDAVVCPNSAVLLDVYEMTSRGLTLDLPGETTVEKVSAVVSRLQRVDPYLGSKLEDYTREIIDGLNGKNKLVRLTTDVLVDIPDSLELTLPRNCTLEQMVIQQKPIYSTDPRYIISGRYFGMMDNANKALTILHEAWYRISLDKNAVDSRFARFMNGAFASLEFSSMTVSEYLNMREEVANNSGSFPVGTIFSTGLSFMNDRLGLNSKPTEDREGNLSVSSGEVPYTWMFTGLPITTNFFKKIGMDIIRVDIYEVRISQNGEFSYPKVCVRTRPFRDGEARSQIKKGETSITDVQGACFKVDSNGQPSDFYSFPNVKSVISQGKSTKLKSNRYVKFHFTQDDLVVDEIVENDCFSTRYDSNTAMTVYSSYCAERK